jgi:hypothetical protein
VAPPMAPADHFMLEWWSVNSKALNQENQGEFQEAIVNPPCPAFSRGGVENCRRKRHSDYEASHYPFPSCQTTGDHTGEAADQVETKETRVSGAKPPLPPSPRCGCG